MGEIYGRFEIGALGSINKVHLIIAYTLIIWLLEAGRLQFVASSLGLNLSMMLVIFVALASSLLTALPITPAGLGAVEFAMIEILALFGVDRNMAVSVAILDRVISYWSIIPLGYFIFVRSGKRSCPR
jgi:glycosyltransferase 2 family protein